MKNKFVKGLLVASLFSMGMASCSKKIDEAYANPNAPVKVPPETLLPNIIASMAANGEGHGTMNDIRYAGAYIQNWQYYATLSNFDRMGHFNNDVAQSIWRMHYYDIGQNNRRMVKWAIEDKKWDYAGVGKAIEAWSWLTLTDYHGEVILKDAFNTDLITFKYDTQPEVYEFVRELCFEALTYLNKTGDNASQANLAKGDQYMYNGDVNKWKKFTYGVLARYHNRFSNKSTYKPDSVIYYANKAMLTNADNAMVKFQGTAQSGTNSFFGPLRGNLAGASTTSPTAIRQGAYIANLEAGLNPAFLGIEDPRAIYILRLNANNTFRGVQPNKGQTALAANDRPENFWGVPQITASNTAPATDAAARFIFRNTSPFPIMTATEMHFLKAEAYFRKGLKTEANQSYLDGIRAHFDMLMTTYNVNIPAGRELTQTAMDNYLADPNVNPGAANLTMAKIMMQKYIAMFGYGVMETWVDMRRFHYTDMYTGESTQVYVDFTPPSGTDLFADNNGKLVYRMRPRFNSEYVWNILELERIGATALDYHTKKVWFAE